MDVFVGRQPILDANCRVCGYELLFRREAGATQAPADLDPDASSCTVILGTIMDIGLDRLVDRGLAFVNCTRGLIVGPEIAAALPPSRAVVEVLEDVEPDAEVVRALKRLRAGGFKIALDDVVLTDAAPALIDVADIVKVDVRAVDRSQLAREAEILGRHPVTLLAEKVETREEFEFCRGLGFQWFQGWFFARPEVVTGRHPESNRFTALRVIARLHDDDVEIAELAEMISLDASLAYALMRVINSPLYAGVKCIGSVHDAVLRLGIRGLRTWLSLIALARVPHKPQELLVMAVLRARLASLIADELGLDAHEAFTAGLFSILDALFDRPLDELLDELPLRPDLSRAIRLREGPLGAIVKIVIENERGNWPDVASVGLKRRRLSELWSAALHWTHGALAALADPAPPEPVAGKPR